MNNYEKKYKEALTWMQSLYDGLHGATKKDAEHYFPELKESEDEKKIKGSLMQYLWEKYHTDYCPIEPDMETCTKWINWLEKQSEPNPYSGVSFKYNGHTWGMCARDNGVDILLDKQFFKHLEKLREQKQDPCDNCKDVMLNCHNFPCIKKRAFKQGKSVLEAIIDEKVDNANKIEPKDYNSIDPHFGHTTDKVKPEFKIGDFVVRKDNELFTNGSLYARITDIKKEQYWFDSGTWLEAKDIRHWNISDAKDGDVLVIQETDFTYESIFIFNKIENNHIIQYLHYFITDTDEEVCKVKSVGGFLGDVGDNVHPATKEQRDTLMKAMADAGYAFNFDKKELKKIEQKSFWSEEDENLLKISVENLTELKDRFGKDYGRVGDCINWLKSLKDRCTWKPSDEQMEAFENFVRGIWEICYDSPYENNAKLLYSLLEQLKKLREE